MITLSLPAVEQASGLYPVKPCLVRTCWLRALLCPPSCVRALIEGDAISWARSTAFDLLTLLREPPPCVKGAGEKRYRVTHSPGVAMPVAIGADALSLSRRGGSGERARAGVQCRGEMENKRRPVNRVSVLLLPRTLAAAHRGRENKGQCARSSDTKPGHAEIMGPAQWVANKWAALLILHQLCLISTVHLNPSLEFVKFSR